ncbi:MAG: zinc ABC transporter substrate-binding protein [Planctomycetota bacterium]
MPQAFLEPTESVMISKRKRKTGIVFRGLAAVAAAAAVWSAAGPARAEAGYKVVGTIGMGPAIVAQVAADRAEVEGLVGSGVDPHLYKPTRSDIRTLMSADVIFYNGLLLEGKMADALIRVASSGKKVVPVTERLDESFLLEPEEFDGLFDPHVWMDPTAWVAAVEVVRDSLTEYDPAGEAFYAANAEATIEKIKATDEYAEKVLESVPENSRVLVTAHDAFNYFGKRYGYEVVAIQGLSTESEAGVRDIERLVDLLVERDIKAVFVETTVSDRNIKALIEGAAARGHTVTIGGELFSDAMGPDGTYEGTYLGMVDHNATTIARALGGDASAGGMQGKLSHEH